MKKIIYPITLFAFLITLTSSISSFTNSATVVPIEAEAMLTSPPPFNYEVTFPENIMDFLQAWGEVDTTLISSITNEKATLGRFLFYDDRLSATNDLSCASCHKQEFSFADDVAFSDGINDTPTTRNSMALNDLGWQLSTSFFWDFRSEGLENAVLEPILAAHELGKDIPTLIAKLESWEAYPEMFNDAYGTTAITEERITNALAVFIASMASFDSKYDQGFNEGFVEFTPSEINGMHLFEEACGFCHVTPHFGASDPMMFFLPGNNGLDSVITDPGMNGWFNDPMFLGFFKAPSMRNVEVTGPYMHDGRFSTLEEVIDFYSEGIQHNDFSAFNWMFGPGFTGYDFSEENKTDLLNFMRTLTDENLLSHAKWSNPWFTTTSAEEAILVGIEVYPNPVADFVTVQMDNSNSEEYSVMVYNVSGKLVHNIQTTANTLDIPRGQLPAGIYQLVIRKENQQKAFKLVYR